MSGLDGATAIAPMVPPKNLSVTGAQDIPPSVVLKTPPPVVPIQYSFGRFAEPATATERPPRYGPSSRHFMPAKAESGIEGDCEEAASGASAAKAAAARVRKRITQCSGSLDGIF